MSIDPLIAHSEAEVRLYLLAARCKACGRGPLTAPPPDGQPLDSTALLSVDAHCEACAARVALSFRLPARASAGSPPSPNVINPGDEPSRIIDVGQWIVLFRVFLESAKSEPEKAQARALGLKAAQCLDEAVKFYDDPENDLPPPEAFFADASRDRLRDSPEQFSRQRLIELRAKLPNPAKMPDGHEPKER